MANLPSLLDRELLKMQKHQKFRIKRVLYLSKGSSYKCIEDKIKRETVPVHGRYYIKDIHV